MTNFLLGFTLGYGLLMTAALGAVRIANDGIKEDIQRQEDVVEELHAREMYHEHDEGCFE